MAGAACGESDMTEQNPAYRDTAFSFFHLPNLDNQREQHMRKKIRQIIHFFSVGLWRIDRKDVSPVRYFLYSVTKGVYMAIELATTKRMIDLAAALTYSTLLAIVPILAVVFAIARGFGYNKFIETWFRETLSSQPQVAETIIGFVNSYLVHTKSGVFLGVGLVFMLWTTIMLIRNIELSFNVIWQVKKPRSLFRTVTDYMAMFLLAPLVIVITSGMSIFITTISSQVAGYALLAPVVKVIIALSPYLLMSIVFIALYLFMPNTKVKLRSAVFPGILAGVAMQGLQLFYIHSQIWVSSYNAIYGSFAALPLFMLWVQISWIICLFGAELCYTSQNLEYFAFKTSTEDLSHRHRRMLSVLLCAKICRRFQLGLPSYTALQLKLETGIPIRIVNDLLFDMTRVKLLVEISTDEKGEDSSYLPAEDLQRLSVGTLLERLDAEGKWSLDLDWKQMDCNTWEQSKQLYKQYIEGQRQLLLKDICMNNQQSES